MFVKFLFSSPESAPNGCLGTHFSFSLETVCKVGLTISWFRQYLFKQMHSGLMVSALANGLSGPGLTPSQGHCVVILGNTLYSNS